MPGATAQSRPSAIRPENAALGTLIQTGLTHSKTFRELVTRLDESDVVVYIRFARCSGKVPACLQFVPGVTGARMVLVFLDRFGRSESDLISLLAHELHHATEVAAASWVVDVESFRRLYEQAGRKGSDGFETSHAKLITRTVAGELAARR